MRVQDVPYDLLYVQRVSKYIADTTGTSRKKLLRYMYLLVRDSEKLDRVIPALRKSLSKS